MVSTELHGLEITCKADEFAVFNPPDGQSCGQWAGAFVQAYGGYIDNPDATDACRYCQYRVGDEFFVPLNISYSNRWRDAWILFAYVIFNALITIGESSPLCARLSFHTNFSSAASRFLRYAKR